MLKRLKLVITLLLLAVVFLPPAVAFAQDQEPEDEISPMATEEGQEATVAGEAKEPEYDFASMTTYEMFWPLVAGRVPGDRFYQLKLWRDELVGRLFFSKLKKSEYLKRLANKRLIEAEKLLELQRYSFLPGTLETAGDNLAEGVELLFSTTETQSREWLEYEYVKDLRKHLVVLERMRDQAEGEVKDAIEKSLEKVKKLTEDYQLTWVGGDLSH